MYCTFDVIATCFGRTWAISRQDLLFGETTALYTLSLVPSGTILLLSICFVAYFHPILFSYHFSVPF
jgi:hypothetical protein